MANKDIEPYKESLLDRLFRTAANDGVYEKLVKPFLIEQTGQLLHQLTDYYFFEKRGGYSTHTSNGISVVDYHGASERKSKRSASSNSPTLITRPFETQAQAKYVLDQMKVILDEYKEVRVSDYYRHANITDRNFELQNKWGWKSLSGVTIRRNGLKWQLVLPPVVWLESEDELPFK